MASTRIIIEAVDSGNMRLEAYRHKGYGDWFVDPSNGDIHIQVAGADVWDQEDLFLLALHELVEARLCFKDGVTQGAVDAFDAAFQGEGEPGDDVASPYRRQHRAAMLVEHLTAVLMGTWDHGAME